MFPRSLRLSSARGLQPGGRAVADEAVELGSPFRQHFLTEIFGTIPVPPRHLVPPLVMGEHFLNLSSQGRGIARGDQIFRRQQFGDPPTAEPMQGRLAAMASSNARGKPSVRDGMMNRSAC